MADHPALQVSFSIRAGDALSPDDAEKRFLSGWYTGAAPLLVSQGLGCEGANFRLGSSAEVWLITLRCR